ncbi:MAG: hypothetical protein IT581_22240 [Verrucomicrobiales bacterium]|nr:hypothetical protein [Verrucomicrobiales bacterium]
MLKTLLWWCSFLAWAATSQAAPVVFQTAGFEYRVSESGTNLGFIDRATGNQLLRVGESRPCAWIQVGAQKHPVTAAGFADGRWTLRFAGAGIEVVIRTDLQPDWVVFTVEAIRGGDPQSLTFLDIPLTLQGTPAESFGACVLSMNLFTRVEALPVLQRDLGASCEAKFGMVGAKAVLVAGPTGRLLSLIQKILERESALPVCRVAGPWARETPFAHGSYLFNFGALDASNVEGWVETVQSLGFNQTDHHGGGPGFFRFGDFELNREKWPEGWASFRRVVDRLHQAGIGSIFHTYAFFIDKKSKYVAPVPDGRLDAFRAFTLAEPLSESATEIVVNEPTSEMRTTTGFFEANSVVLHLGNELVTFGGASKVAPWTFTNVTRGALGTRAQSHERGARARHLKEMFGLFVPDVGSTLFEEIAANHAQVVNDVGFDGLYLDAIDGSGILRGNEEFWYWSQKFVIEIQKRLKRPVGMEMSAMSHHFWQYRTRWQAWDYPRRGHKRFIDQHAAGVDGGLMLPLHLGWWNLQAFEPPQFEPTYPDVMEHLGARMIGWDAGVSLTAGVSRGALRETPLFRRSVEILKTCEELRASKTFDEATRAQLRDPRHEFALFRDPAGRPRFRRVQTLAQTVSMNEPWTKRWSIAPTNVSPNTPLRLRIESLMGVDAADSQAVVLANLGGDESKAWSRSAAVGIEADWRARLVNGSSECLLVATNAGKVPRKGAWARASRVFDPVVNVKDRQGLLLEIEGDGSGAVVALRQESPAHIAYGGFADRYVVLDFVGRRTVALVETESTRWSDYDWGDGKGLYHAYRESAHFDAISQVSVFVQNLPPGRETRIGIGPMRAIALRPAVLVDPRITVAGRELVFQCRLPSGSWVEANGPDDCQAYGPKGEPLGKVGVRGEWPKVNPGTYECGFDGDAESGSSARARVVIFADGEPL